MVCGNVVIDTGARDEPVAATSTLGLVVGGGS